jgi:hypothetical protein
MTRFSKISAGENGSGEAWDGTEGTEGGSRSPSRNKRKGMVQRSISMVERGGTTSTSADGTASRKAGPLSFIFDLFRRSGGGARGRHNSLFNPKAAEYRSVVEEVRGTAVHL